MKLLVLPQGVFLDGKDLLKLSGSEYFLSCIGKPSRRRDIPMHSGEKRVAMVWDSLGLVAYEDQPGHRMSHLILAFSAEDTPERPQQASGAVIEINGGIVTSESTEHSLPLVGATPISEDYGKHFFHQADDYEVNFLFERLPDTRSRNIRTGRLQSFSFSWR